MKLADRFKFDDRLNLVYIDGHPFCAELLDAFTTPSKPDQWFRIVESEPGGAVVIETRPARDVQASIQVGEASIQVGDMSREELLAALRVGWAASEQRIRRLRQLGMIT